MRTPMAGKTKVTLAVGFVIFVAGTAGAAYLGSRNTAAPPGAASSGSSRPTVLYAAQPVPAGTSGSVALAQGLVRSRAVAATALPPGAVTDATQLSGRVAVRAIEQGTILTGDLFPAPQTRIGTVQIPAGKRALALELQPVAGVAGFVGAGDRIDIYGVADGTRGSPRGVHLVLQSVEVLNVNGTGLPATQGQPNGPNLVYLLAVTPAEAERLIYLTSFEDLYFDLVPSGEARVTTPGAGPDQALQAL